MSRTHPILTDHVYIGDLSPRRQRAVRMFIERFRKGAIEHDDIDEQKPWTPEMIEEMGDMAFYSIFKMLGTNDAGL